MLDEQYDTNPTSLLALVQMILGVTYIENQTENNTEVRSAVLSITQLLAFNAMKWCRKDTWNISFRMIVAACIRLTA